MATTIAWSGSPFDWRITQGSGVNVDIEERPDKSWRRRTVMISNMTSMESQRKAAINAVCPQYQLRYVSMAARWWGRAVEWRSLALRTLTQPFVKAAIRGCDVAWCAKFTSPVWRRTALRYSVRPTSMRVRLGGLATGSIWFDELQISRAAGVQAE